MSTASPTADFVCSKPDATAYPPLPELIPTIKSHWRNQIGFCGSVLLTGVSMLVLVFLCPICADLLIPPIGLNDFRTLSAALVASVAVIALHEAGHLLAAICMRFTILSVRIGPLRISQLYGKCIVQVSLKGFFTGSVSAIPSTGETSWRMKMLAVVAAGPMATLFCFLAAASALSHTSPEEWVHLTLSIVTALSFVVFVLGFAPNGKDTHVRSDAQLIYAILLNGSEASDIYAYHQLTQLKLSGDRPHDYAIDLIRSLAVRRTRPDIALACADTIVLWALDRGDAATACAWDRRALELSLFCNRELRNLAIANSAWLDVVLRRDLQAAKRNFARVRFEEIRPTWLRQRLAAAWHTAEGRVDLAHRAISRARQHFPECVPYFGFEELQFSKLTESVR